MPFNQLPFFRFLLFFDLVIIIIALIIISIASRICINIIDIM